MQAENNEVDDDDNVQQLPAVLVNIVFCLRVWRCSPSSPTACRLILYHIYRHHWQPHAHVFVVVVYFYVLCVYTLCVCMCVSFTYKHLYQFMLDYYIVTQDYQFLRLTLPDIYLSFDIYLQWVLFHCPSGRDFSDHLSPDSRQSVSLPCPTNGDA